MNAVELLLRQHMVVREGFYSWLEKDVMNDAVLLWIADQLVAHMIVEEHLFYPRVRELSANLITESCEEHNLARYQLGRAIIAPAGDRKIRVKVLEELWEHHADEEERVIFPKLQSELGAAELEALGARMQAMFHQALEEGFARFVVEDAMRRSGAQGVNATDHRGCMDTSPILRPKAVSRRRAQ